MDGGTLDPIGRKARAEVIDDEARVRIGHAVGLVEDELEALRVGREAAPVRVLAGVVVFLRVDDPGDRVDAGQELIHGRAVLPPYRVHVRQVEDGDVVEPVAVMRHDRFDIQPAEQRGELGLMRCRHPGDGRVGRGPDGPRRADDVPGQRVEDRRLPHPGAAGQRHDVDRPEEPRSLRNPLRHLFGGTRLRL
jgi:hypothetical protein